MRFEDMIRNLLRITTKYHKFIYKTIGRFFKIEDLKALIGVCSKIIKCLKVWIKDKTEITYLLTKEYSISKKFKLN